MFNVVLYQPEIPSNAGNIGRICVGSNAKLHIIKPMRFLLTDKHLARAGLDYWDKLDITIYDDLSDFYEKCPQNRVYFCSTKGNELYTQVKYEVGDFFMFGPETKGLPNELLKDNNERVIKIPISNDIRSINLANSVAIVLYEALRQTGFEGLS